MSDKKRFAIIFTIILSCTYLLALSGLYFFQENILFLNIKSNPEVVKELKTLFPGSELFLTTKDQNKLHGWHLPKKNTDILNICFNGNGEEASYISYFWHQHLKGAVITYNYRGYGKSTGFAGQEKLCEDSLLIYDSIKTKYPQYKKIFIVGRSLGSGVACYLASKREVDGLLLISPYDSILNISKQKYPIFPVALCLRHPFDSQKFVTNIQKPIFFIVAENDSLIPKQNSLNLFEKCTSKKEIHSVANAGHNSIFNKSELFKYLKDFYIFTGN